MAERGTKLHPESDENLPTICKRQLQGLLPQVLAKPRIGVGPEVVNQKPAALQPALSASAEKGDDECSG
jgi:hypothetical protein